MKQFMITLAERPRGFHLISDELERQLPLSEIGSGLLHLQLQHTSASLTLNENCDPTVRGDFSRFFDRLVADGTPYFQHDYEGDDDMPAHIKSSILGTSLMLPVRQGRLGLGTWQGIYLGEHRDHGGKRKVLVTSIGG
ncbi:secondary thiamine-phosphate synthase enzyme YjbQ [Ferrimonas aestuarii]|uniref:YjbQ family protein n=1 Tax=Ferrimonas aestuarii TaxID=2569539 RepID=A0A4U1BR27_9GAMM|nr:secondary thiamine-phosphate synthase enzyme YjbQ [Ferrimonas aestuarii]TKB56822.1 YjbQ family protein [Ferrimonas aestuarii]